MATLSLALKDLTEYDSYDSITSEEIWDENLALHAGVLNLTADIYMEQVYTQKPGDKPWLICIVAQGVQTAYWQSTYLAKSLFFMQKILADQANYAMIETTNELLRETFENNGVPQCIYVKDGKPYYAAWHRISVKDLHDFMLEPETYKMDAFPYLQAVPSSLTVYPQYYMKEIGLILRKLSKLASTHVKPILIDTLGLQAWYPERLERKFSRLCLQPYPKTAAINFFNHFVLPYSLFGILPLVCISRCWRGRKVDVKKTDLAF